MKSSLEIAQAHRPIPIEGIAERAGLIPDELEPYGRYKAKVRLCVLDRLSATADGKLVCVTGTTPTRAGEGSTTTLLALAQGLGAAGRRAVACLREPSMGPVFGARGGAVGGGYAQAVPIEDLNLHFTGDIHAIGAANNLLAAMIDAAILHGNRYGIDVLKVPWRRAVDTNDRALRKITVGLQGRPNGYPRETGFDITAASEVMAIVAVARGLMDLRRRIGHITAAYSYDGGEPVTAEDLGTAGAMTVLLKDALKPNLVQTLEGQPVLVHCGPFGNIDHGNNSLVADLVALKLGDYVLTESGFGSDMGMEKFFNIVCRFGGFRPSAVVLVTTVRSLKHHGGRPASTRGDDNVGIRALSEGIANLRRHLEIIHRFRVPVVVAINRRSGDRKTELGLIADAALESGARAAVVNDGFARGGAGAAELAEAVVSVCEEPNDFRYLYADEQSIADKIETIATQVYGARDIFFYPEAERQLARFDRDGLGRLPVCIAKSHLSLSADPGRLNAPKEFTLPVRDVRAYTGAGWLVPLCGEITQMPGLGERPAAMSIDIDGSGRTVGLF